MDPNATLKLIQDCRKETDEECVQACTDLMTWLLNRGFEPDWDSYPKGTRRYDRFLDRESYDGYNDMHEPRRNK